MAKELKPKAEKKWIEPVSVRFPQSYKSLSLSKQILYGTSA